MELIGKDFISSENTLTTKSAVNRKMLDFKTYFQDN